MIEAEWWDYESPDEMAEAVAGDIGFIVGSALDARASALIALPGDELAQAIFPTLAAAELQWRQVTIIPTDDRLVPVDSEESNARAIAQDVPADRGARDPDRHCPRRLPAGRQCRRRPASGPAVAAGPRLAQRRRRRKRGGHSRRTGLPGRAGCAQGAPRRRSHARK
jgi:hypothetical protein